ncbi:hypothetical protein [Thalassovita aquimarina]|uniref:YaiO family outer membrane beta-barrel protein n=1 Tax=Thalassovita aquimarina TaxID=2785917 RepID=A0ABS5HNY1_9RHOB|nr:hypothetical protein [Thalassovita aquimarina]MBR9650624.1 hypothetical protein [Thalassovita aquimarina]
MNIMHRILAFILCLLPVPALAGAWLRDEGRGFYSSSAYLLETGSGGQNYAGIYLEYGMTPRLTAGLDLGRGVSGDTKSIAFLRWPLGAATGAHRFAIEAGLGEIAGNPTFRPGLSYGYGFGGGWVSLETAAELNLRTNLTDYKADLTFGLNRGRRDKLLMQVQSGKAAGDPAFLRLVPSITRDIGRGWQIEFGFAQEVTSSKDRGLKLGLWKEF